MEPKQLHPLKALQLLHRIMLLMQVVFAIIMIGLIASGFQKPSAKDLNSILQVVVIVIGSICYFAGTHIFKKKVSGIKEANITAAEKFSQYRSASILLWAILEGPTLFCIISFFLTGNYAFIALAVVLLFFFFIFGVNRQKLFLFIGLSEEEIDGLK
jgi:ABC-type dipeptide/oligopeptide/nickel transport system permease subunit